MKHLAIHVTISGQGGHGSRPDLSVNPINCYAALYDALSQQLPVGCTFAVTHIDGGTQRNIIPDRLVFDGTFSFESDTAADFLRSRTEHICRHICAACGCTCQIQYYT